MDGKDSPDVEWIYPLSYHEYLSSMQANPALCAVTAPRPGVKKVWIVSGDHLKYSSRVRWVYFPGGTAPLPVESVLNLAASYIEPVHIVGVD